MRVHIVLHRFRNAMMGHSIWSLTKRRHKAGIFALLLLQPVFVVFCSLPDICVLVRMVRLARRGITAVPYLPTCMRLRMFGMHILRLR